MCSKIMLFLSSILIFIVMFDRIRNNVVLKLYFKYETNKSGDEKNLLFDYYLKKFNKSYGKGELQMRYRNFKENLVEIRRMNAGSRHAKFGLTKFSDWSKEELAEMLNPTEGHCEPKILECNGTRRKNGKGSRNRRVRQKTRPSRLDWREHHAVGPVLNQKRCSACWAFSIIGVMESRAFIQKYGFNQLSIQELIDCSYSRGEIKTGCHKGRPLVRVLDYLCKQKFRVTTEANYPLTLADEHCRVMPGLRGLSRYVNSCDMYKNESKLLDVLNDGPVTALVDAKFLFNYNQGVISGNCETTVGELNHAVQIVGYDTTASPPYYILRNSWDTNWGEKGYARLEIGSNQCGIAFSIGYFDVN